MKASALPAGGSKQDALIRALLTPVVSPPGIVAAVIFAGAGSPAGLILAVAPLYLLWVGLSDVYALVANLFAPRGFTTRRGYFWFAAASMMSFAVFWCWNRFLR